MDDPLSPTYRISISRRIISGGRYGEVRVWSLEAALEDTEDTEEMTASRELRLHDRSTAVGQVKLLRAQAGTKCGLRREGGPSINYICSKGGDWAGPKEGLHTKSRRVQQE